MKKYILILFAILILSGGYFIYKYYARSKITKSTLQNSPSASLSPSLKVSPLISPQNEPTFPINEFSSRITKKPFGIYITPATSPVQPERFSGYHTGADVEYEDITADVPVYAVADGTVVLSRTASGYGGVFMIEINLNSAIHTVLYGHIRPSSLPKVGQVLKKGEQVAVLGTGYSNETDGERRHLHFSVLFDNQLVIKGYVQNKSDLSSWLDPQTLYK